MVKDVNLSKWKSGWSGRSTIKGFTSMFEITVTEQWKENRNHWWYLDDPWESWVQGMPHEAYQRCEVFMPNMCQL